MKCRTLSLVLVALVTGVLVTALLAQNSLPPTSNKVLEAFALLKAGQPKQAQDLIALVPATDPYYPAAQCCNALCLYEFKDSLGFLKVMNTPAVIIAPIPPELREEMDYKQIDALSFYRKFDELLPKADAFVACHTNSPLLAAVAEFKSAALYERGMKKVTESGILRSRGDAAGAEKRLKEGQESLGRFLRLSACGLRDGYQTLKGRDSQTELVKALTVLGGESEVLKTAALADREATALAILQISIKTKPDAVDENLSRMTNFLKEFPNNPHLPRVRYEMANSALEEGWRRTWARKSASSCLTSAFDMFKCVVTDKKAGVSEADVREANLGILRVYYAKRDWINLSSWVDQNITNVQKGGKEWLAIKVYYAAGLACQQKTDQASKELDEIMATGFKGNPSYDGLLVCAAKWRVRVAKHSGDDATIKQVAELVEKSACYDSLKRSFAAGIKEIVEQPSQL